MSSFSDFFSGVGKSLGINDALKKSAKDVGAGVGQNLKDAFAGGISYLQNDFYGVPTGDPTQVVTKKSGSPAVVAGKYANVKTSNKNGGSSRPIISGVTNQHVIYAAVAIVAILMVVKK